MSWYDFACKILSALESFGISVTSEVIPISSKSFNQKALRPKYSALSNSKLVKKFIYQITPLNDAIHHSINTTNLNL